MLKRRLKSLLLSIAPQVWVAWYDFRRPKSAEQEIDLLPALVAKGGVGVDVGANVGLYMRPLSKLCRVVHVVEPQPHMVSLLRRVAARNVVIHECGASDHAGSANLLVPVSNGADVYGIASLEAAAVATEHRTYKVQLARLDELVTEPVDFIKVDIEGHELPALEGAKGILDRSRPNLLVEAEDRHRPGATADLFAFTASHGYAGYFLQDGRLRPIREFNLAMQDQGALAKGGARRPGQTYINNFIFVPTERAELFLENAAQLLKRRPGQMPPVSSGLSPATPPKRQWTLNPTFKPRATSYG